MTDHKASLTSDHKVDLDDVYTAPDPRPYYRRLARLDYQIPEAVAPVLDPVLEAARLDDGGSRTVLDVCCSYGVNAAVAVAGSVQTVSERYAQPPLADAPPDALVAADAAYFAARPLPYKMVGLDTSEPAVDYAVSAGLLADGWSENLEEHDPSPALSAGIADVGAIACSGGVGYIGRPTFARLLDATARPDDMRLAVWVLRVFDYGDVAELLNGYGLVTEQLPGTVRQRRFDSPTEQAAAIQDVVERGLDPTGREADGWFHATCYVSRPAAEAARIPIEDLLAV